METIIVIFEILIIILLIYSLYARLKKNRKDSEVWEDNQEQKEVVNHDNIQIRATTESKREEKGPKVDSVNIDDLQNEAAIYMQYGHYSQAATVLRWYLDVRPDDTLAINRLLDAYLALPDIDAYAELLESLGEEAIGDNMDWWRNRVTLGLEQDPGNLELLVMAEKLNIPIPKPGETCEPMTAAKALVLASRNQNPNYAIPILLSAIYEDPLRLSLYAELLRINHRLKNVEGYVDGLVLLFIALGDNMIHLQKRMLRAGKSIQDSQLFQILEEAIDRPSQRRRMLLEMARKRNLHITDKFHYIG